MPQASGESARSKFANRPIVYEYGGANFLRSKLALCPITKILVQNMSVFDLTASRKSSNLRPKDQLGSRARTQEDGNTLHLITLVRTACRGCVDLPGTPPVNTTYIDHMFLLDALHQEQCHTASICGED